jgi:hypothetical protein
LRIFTSDDNKTWTLRHDNAGKHFGGVSGAKSLDVRFKDGEIRARFVRLQIPSDKPIFFHLDEVEVCPPGENAKNIALHKPADQSSVSQWSTAKVALPAAPASYPTAEWIARGRKLAADLAKSGVDVAQALGKFDALEKKLVDVRGPDDALRALYLETRWAYRRLAFANPLLNLDKLLFVKRYTQETYPDVCLNHMPWVSKPGGDICVLATRDGTSLFAALSDPHGDLRLRSILNRALGPGHVHGMDLWWDADRVVFGYAKTKTDAPPDGWLNRSKSYDLRRSEEPTHLFEIGVDGRNLRHLTSGEWSDLDPTYLPSGDIAFISERCGYSLQCNEYDKDETSCNLYVMRPDGSAIRRLSVNKDGDYLPHTLDDGSIGYTRWEYHERSFAFIQSIWIVRPDGTGADSLYKQHMENPWALYDVRSIPGTSKLAAVAGGHHTLYCGPVCVIDPTIGMNDPQGLSIVTPNVKPQEGGMSGFPVAEGGVQDAGGLYMTPWPLSEKHFLVSYSDKTLPMNKTDPAGYALYLIDVFGTKELVYRDPAISSSLPIPLRPRTKPPVLPDAADPAKDHAVCVLSNASYGVDGIAPEKIRYVRIAEALGWPYDNKFGGHRYGEDHGGVPPLLNWTPVAILGDVPVESDGSAHFTVPVDRMVYFQLLDENRMEIRRMRSFISFQPGEQRGCVGCHETRSVAVVSAASTMAYSRAPSEPFPMPWGVRPVSFLRDIQPVFDQHCVSCHSGLKPAGGMDFFGGLTSHHKSIPGYGYNRAFETLLEKKLVSRSDARAQDASITPPMAYGSHKSKLIQVLKSGACSTRAKLSDEDWLRLTAWIDSNAPYHDGFVNKRAETPAYDMASDQTLQKGIAAVHEQRCAACHKSGEVSRLDWIDVREAKRSVFLTAPLAKEAGGSARCKEVVYRDANDAAYQAVLRLVEAAVKKAWASPRRDLRR